MAKLKPGAITPADLNENLQTRPGFSFEVGVLKTLIELGFSCDHAGSYSDRTTGKERQFDIRAMRLLPRRPPVRPETLRTAPEASEEPSGRMKGRWPSSDPQPAGLS